jgi:hypothetical protein
VVEVFSYSLDRQQFTHRMRNIFPQLRLISPAEAPRYQSSI